MAEKVWLSGQCRCLTSSLKENYHQSRSRAPNRCGCWYQPSTLAGQGLGGGLSLCLKLPGAGYSLVHGQDRTAPSKASLVHFLKQPPNSWVRG